jgi:hypothetical protein
MSLYDYYSIISVNFRGLIKLAFKVILYEWPGAIRTIYYFSVGLGEVQAIAVSQKAERDGY